MDTPKHTPCGFEINTDDIFTDRLVGSQPTPASLSVFYFKGAL
jgi:hypothetical protein